MIQPFAYEKPGNLGEATALLRGGAIPLAGGSDLIPLLKLEVKSPPVLVDLSGLEELRGIRVESGHLVIGAMETLQSLRSHPLVHRYFPALASSARQVASPQIRNIGTIGGNILQDRRCLYFNQSHEWRSALPLCWKTGGSLCHQAPASPVCRALYYSDVATALYVYQTQTHIVTPDGPKTLPITEACEGHSASNGTAAPLPQIITAFSLPLPVGEETISCFVKRSVRQSLDFPIFNAALCANLEGGTLRPRLAVGAIHTTPVLLTETEDLIREMGAAGFDADRAKTAALTEINRRAQPVREAALNAKGKRASFLSVHRLFDILAEALQAFM